MKQTIAQLLLCFFGAAAVTGLALACWKEPVIGVVIIVPVLLVWAVANA